MSSLQFTANTCQQNSYKQSELKIPTNTNDHEPILLQLDVYCILVRPMLFISLVLCAVFILSIYIA
jgi:hypothetical protein